jgi:hypothetical protein
MTPRIIELVPAGETWDGAHLYMRPFEAAMVQSGSALGQLCRQYPRETAGVLAAAAWATVSGYFLSEALKPAARRRAGGDAKSKVNLSNW